MSYKPSVHIKELPRALPREPSPEPEPAPVPFTFSAGTDGRGTASMHLKKLPSGGPPSRPTRLNRTGIHIAKVSRAPPPEETDPPRGSKADLAARRAQRAANVRRRRLASLGMSVHSVPGKSPRNRAFGRSPRARALLSPRVANGVLRGPGRPSRHTDPNKHVNIVTPRSITVPGSVTPLEVPRGLSAPAKPDAVVNEVKDVKVKRSAKGASETVSAEEAREKKKVPAAPSAPPPPPSVQTKAPAAPPPPPPVAGARKTASSAPPPPPPPPPSRR